MRICICCIALSLFACASGTISPRARADDDQDDLVPMGMTPRPAPSMPTENDPSDQPGKTSASGGSGSAVDVPPISGGTGGKGGAAGNDDEGSGGKGTAGKADDGDDEGGGGTKPDDNGDDGEDDKPPPSADCFDAKKMWFEDYETGDYSRWTSKTYNANWGNDCQDNATTTESFHSPGHAQRSEITCPYTADAVHRGYGGLQFSGDTILPAYTNQGVGLDAPNGVVTVMWMRLDSPTVFANGKWVNFWTVEGSCNYTDDVLTLGLEDTSDRLSAAHYASGAGGTRTFSPNAPKLPRGQWVRITVYVNYHTGVMHVWQDGASLEHVTFDRALKTMCQFHWGLYASSNNDNVVLFEDDKSFWKLNEAWTDWDKEPYFGEEVATCDAD